MCDHPVVCYYDGLVCHFIVVKCYRLLYDNLLDVGTNLSFQTLLPSYGHVIRFYVTSPNTALSVNDVVLTLGKSGSKLVITMTLCYD